MCPPQWYKECPARLGLESQAVKERFPGFQFRRTADGTLCLKGKLRTLSGATYEVVLIYPPDFPQTAPKVFPVPRLEGPHQYSDGSMCLFGADDRVWVSTSTAPVILALAALWLNVREHWLKTGKWLGRQHR